MTGEKENLNETSLDIAVIGMVGRFPGAKNLEEFWENLKSGKECVSHFIDQELLEYGIDAELIKNPNYVKAKSVLEDLELFDAQFFGYSHREAQIMDPQIRIMHECIWHALEDAGCDPESYNGMIGLYVGASTDSNWLAHSLVRDKLDNLTIFENAIFGYKDLISTLISYRLNLKGSSYSVYTTCSTSLVAIHLACRGLLTGECHMVVAGGITITLPKKFGYLCQEGMVYSTDGHCRPFDANANGTVFGDGIGVVVLKRLEDALEDEDRIYAVIKASSANNDGRRKVGYTAPSVEGQADVIKNTLYLAEVEPESISYIEAHGTGTIVGDPIEIDALRMAFHTDKKQYCGIGSVKSNVGHLHAAAGVAGFIKTVLALYHRQLPPSTNFTHPNPKIDFENSPFYVNHELREWNGNGYPLRAGVSSFGIGGTNVHVVLEESPIRPSSLARGMAHGARGKHRDSVVVPVGHPYIERSHQLILLSAKTEASVFRAAENLVNYVKRYPETDLADIAYTLHKGRRAFQHRKMLVCSNTEALIDNLVSSDSTAVVQKENNPIVFMFSGQGSQYVNMGLELYRTEKIFRQEIDRCFDLLDTIMGTNIKNILYPDPWGTRGAADDSTEEMEMEKEKINEMQYTSPIKFIFEYALARLMMEWGIIPHAMIGHSFGEYTAACLAGVFSLEDALKLTALRGKLYHQTPKGAMTGVSLAEDQLKARLKEKQLEDKISIAAVNATSLCIISGNVEAVEAFENQLTQEGHEWKRLRVPRAAHSKMMESIMEEFRQGAEQVTFFKPKIPYISGLTGTWVRDDQAVDPGYWARHLRQTIRFYDGLTELLKEENTIFAQIGSDRSLSNFVNLHPGKKPGNLVLNLIRHPKNQLSDVRFLLERLGLLWINGITFDWKVFYMDQPRILLSLPGYAFEPTPYLSKAFYSTEIRGIREEVKEKDEVKQIPADLRVSPLEFQRPELKSKFSPPSSQTEKAIANIWQTVFGFPQVGIHDSFFELGGDSLTALKVVSQINKQLDTDVTVSEIFVYPTIAELAPTITGNKIPTEKYQYPEKTPDPGSLHLPFLLTDIQLSYLIGRKAVFEMGGVSTHAYQELETRLDIQRLNHAFNQVIKRHPMLHTIFINNEQQMVLKEIPRYEIQVEGLEHLDQEAQQERILKERKRMSHFIFSPDRWPLFEIKAFKISKDTHYLCIGLDMLICDGASIGILARDIWAYYENSGAGLPELEFTFRDYMLAFEELKSTEVYARDKEYWLNKLEEFPLTPSLPLKCSPSQVKTPHFNRCHRRFPAAEWEVLKAAAKHHNITPSAFLVTVYAEVLAYWSNQPCLAFNLTVFNRFPFHKDVNQIVGDFTSVILLGIDLRPHTTFWEKAAEVQKVLIEGLEHRHYDGVDFIRELSRYHDMTHQAVMPIIFTSVLFSNEGADISSLDRLGERKMGLSQTPQVFLDYQASAQDGALLINWDYVEDLFEEETLHSMFEHYIMILTSILRGRDDYRLAPQQEVLDMIQQYNRTEEGIPPAFLHQMFMDQVPRTPHHPAVEFGSDSITYKELDEKSNQVAYYLREKGVKPNQLVGILTHRRIETIVNVMGILKAGGAYVPIDPDYPQDRQDYIYSNSKCRLMITPQLYREKNLTEYPTGALNNVNDLENLAYVIYTSGSTGRPKGVMETHKEVSNTIIDINRKFQVNENDRIMAISSMCFDLSVYDVFGSLSTGATLVLISSQKNVKEIIEAIYEKKITIWNSVPAIMDMTVGNMDFYLKPGDKEEPVPDDLARTRNSIFARLQVETAEKTPGTSEEKIYYWSPSVAWKIQGNRLRIDRSYFSGAALEVFPEFYFLTQEGAAVNTIIQHFPRVNGSQLKQFINQLIEKRVLVDSILSPEEVFQPQTRLFKNIYSEEILYNEELYNEFKKFQVTRTFAGGNKGKIQLNETGQFPSFITGRRSFREFDQAKKIPFVIFSTLLSIFKQTPGKDIRYYYYASAGGLYPIDVFVYVKEDRVEQMARGLYYYNPIDSSLNLVDDTCVITADIHYMGNKEIFNASAFSIFMIYDAGVTMPKYRENGYFYACIDTGVMVGTLTQAAELLGIGLCSIGSVNFQRIRDHFILNENQVLVHTIELGLKPAHINPGVSKEIAWEIKEKGNPGEMVSLTGTGTPSLRVVLLSGDWIPLGLPGKIWKYFPQTEIIGLGGATEGSIWSIYYPIKGVRDTWKSIPYGYPLANQQFYVLDFQGRFCPIGVPGELYIGGIGVAEGYMGDPEKTAYSFIHHETLGRLYRTGDFGALRKEGYIEFLGRRDSQVKIRGHRIELGEIETRLLELAGVKETVVIVKEVGTSKILCAFVVMETPVEKDQWLQTSEELKRSLVQRLPDYMIPTSFVQLDRLPVTSTGKIDRKKFSKSEIQLYTDVQYAPPENPVEEKLEEIFANILGVEKIGINDNFFQMGGDSLKAIAAITEIRQQLNIDLPLQDVFVYSNIRSLSDYICAEYEPVMGQIGAAAPLNNRVMYLTREADWEHVHEPFALTHIQRAYVLGRHSYFEMGGISTHVYMEIEAALDIVRLNNALDKLIRRHPMLRAVVLNRGQQKILEEIPKYRITVQDLRDVEETRRNQLMLQERERMSHHIFKIDTWPLFEIKAFHLPDEKYYLFIGFDLVIGDAASVHIVSTELAAFYLDPDLELPELEFTFRDYVLAHEEIKELEVYARDKNYWLTQLEDFPTAPALPFNQNPSEIVSPRFNRHTKLFTPSQWKKLQEVLEDRNMTPAVLLCTAYAEVLVYWSNQPKLAINLPVFNRYPFHKDVERLVGDFTSVVLLRVEFEPGKNFWEKAERIKTLLMEALEHRHYDGVEFIAELGKRDGSSLQAVMPIVFTSLFFDIRDKDDSLRHVETIGEMKMSISQTSQVFIDNQVIEADGGLRINWDYVEDLFEPEVIATMFQQYIQLVETLIRGEESYEFQPAKIDQKLTEYYNQTAQDIPATLLQQMFKDQAALTPYRIAVEFLDKKITYKELDERSNQVAHYLMEQGIAPNDLVGLMGNRCIQTIINVMGILKAGGAYVPLDPDFPEDRREYIYHNSNCKLMVKPDLYRSKQLNEYPRSEKNNVNTLDDLAYIIYTSGSTGRPKGVIETHREVSNTIIDINRKFHVNENHRIMGVSSLCFDLSVYDIFGTLGVGAVLVLIKTQKDVAHLIETLENKAITLWNSVPAIMDLTIDYLPEGGVNQQLKIVMLSGDWIPLSLPGKIKKHFPQAETFSLGGATEGSIWSIYYPIQEVKDTWKSIPYGYPLANQQFYVLDFQKRLCPIGVPGELYIGGAGVAEGYMADEEKTANSFIHHEKLGRLYRTGDFGVFRKQGYIEFLGRRDNQIKIRGYRIELGEIETRLQELQGIKDAVVVVKEHEGNKLLCTFLVPETPIPGTQWSKTCHQLRQSLTERLPDYMIPSTFIQLDQLPMTPTGKIDRKTLSGFEVKQQPETEYEAPESEVEAKLVEIFTNILGAEKIGINDNFFQLGGDSLKAIAVVTEIRKQLNIDLPLEELFVHINIKNLSDYICAEFEPVIGEVDSQAQKVKYLTREADWENLHEPFALTHIQRAYVLGRHNYFEMGGISTHIYQEVEAAVDIQRLNNAMNKLIKRHPMLRAVILDDGRQIILEEIPQYRIQVEDLRHLETDRQQQLILKERERMSHYIFKTDTWPLFEIKAFNISAEKYYLFIGLDLLIGDAASMYILNMELIAFYLDPHLELPELEFTFRDYVLAHEEIKELEVYARDKNYWLAQLEDFPTAPALPFKQKPSEIVSPRFKRHTKFFKPSQWKKLQEILENRNMTPAVLLCTAYAEVMVYWSNQPITAINLPVFNRYPFHKDVERLVGDFTSVVLLRVEFEPALNSWEKAERIKTLLMEALEHRHYDGVEFIAELGKRDGSGMQAVMPIVFTSTFFDIKDKDGSLRYVEPIGEMKMSISQTSQVFIDNQVIEADGGLRINWDYVEDLFAPEVIATMFQQYIQLVETLINGKENYEFQPAKSTQTLIEHYNHTAQDIPPTLLQQMFEDQAALTPHRIAVEFLDEIITYKELDERSNQVAWYLREQGTKPNGLVGLMGNRCIQTIVNVMGILKAGGAYVPLDPDFPEDRRNYIYHNSNCKLIVESDLCQAKHLHQYPMTKVDNVNTPGDLAYVIYTSGSTGRPKGVIETHRAAANTILDINQRFNVNENHKIMGISSLCFDLSVYDIFGTLGTGAVLVLIKDQKDIPHLVKTLDDKRITLWNSVPAIMDLAVNHVMDHWPRDYINLHLGIVLLSGDWIPLALPGKIKKHFPAAEIVSLGGATEASIWSIHYPIKNGEVKATWKSIPYGRPLANQEFYVLNFQQQLCPLGVPGELYIGGDGLASGYLNDVEKHHTSFIRHPRLGNLYRTGDYGVFHKEGYIEFLGRRDQQVKIKGYRIELGEIENQLLKQKGVKEAIVVVKQRENGEKYLCAYIAAPAAGDFTQRLRTNLSQTLPDYMIPSFFILLDKIPLTSNGKVNRKELPETEEARKSSLDVHDYAVPETEIEKNIVDICSEVVQLGRIGIYDNFFEIGITSVDVANINKKLRETFKIHLPIIKMFEFSTVNTLAEYISFEIEAANGKAEAVPVSIIDNKPLQIQTMDRGKNRKKQRKKKKDNETMKLN